MNEEILEKIEETSDPINEESNLEFECPKCGVIPQEEVVFICNKCDSKEMIQKEGAYLCPQCLTKGENFMCMNCDSKEVKLKSKL